MNNTKSLISNFRRVSNVVSFLLDDFLAVEFHRPENHPKKDYNTPKSIRVFKRNSFLIPVLTHISALQDTKTALNNKHSNNTKVKIMFQCLLNLLCNKNAAMWSVVLVSAAIQEYLFDCQQKKKRLFDSPVSPGWVLGPTQTSFNLATKVVSPCGKAAEA